MLSHRDLHLYGWLFAKHKLKETLRMDAGIYLFIYLGFNRLRKCDIKILEEADVAVTIAHNWPSNRPRCKSWCKNNQLNSIDRDTH